MTKTCSKCSVEKSISEFYRKKSSPDGYRTICKSCHSDDMAKHRAENKGRYKQWNRKTNLKLRYGLTVDEFDSMMERQRFSCAICSSPLSGEADFAVDHNHSTGEVRGILCPNCNSGIGYLQDNPAVLKAAAKYLEDKGYYGKS